MPDDIKVDRRDSWIEITIYRPDKLNAIREQTAVEILDVMTEVESVRELRGLIITGGEKAFCTGVDTSEQKNEPDEAFELWRRRKRSRKVNQFFRALPEFTKPVIAAVEGYAVAGGLELALWCDLRVAATNATFGVFNRRFGVPLIDLGTIRLPRMIGQGRALDLILTGRPVVADEALRIGLVERLVRPGHALAEAQQLAQDIAESPPGALRADRMSVLNQWSLTLDEAARAEFRGGSDAMASGEAQAGARRFTEGSGRHGS